MDFTLPTPDAIEALAAEAGMTGWQACKEAGVTVSTLSRWKLGRTTPSVRTLERIVKAIEKRAAMQDAG